MIKCPFCHFDNEEGALFCEQCKSDLSGVGPAIPQAEPVIAEAIPLAAEPLGLAAEPVFAAEPVPAIPLEPIPVTAEPAVPMAEPIVPMMELAPPPAPPAVPAAIPATPVPPAAVVPAIPAPTAPPGTGQAPAATPAAPAAGAIPAGAQPRLLVLRGQKRNVEYPLYEGLNYIGRADEKPVDIDLEDQEPPDRIWCSRQHAVISFEGNALTIEDLNSANGTYVNRAKIYPGQPRTLVPNDIIQIGNVQLKVIV